MDKKSWLQKLESMEQEQPETTVPDQEPNNMLRDVLEGRGKYVILGGIGLFLLVLLILVFSGGESRSEKELQDILARLEVIESKLVGFENQESGRQQALVRMQGDFGILTMRVDKLSREIKEQLAEAPGQPTARQATAQAARPAQQPATPQQPTAQRQAAPAATPAPSAAQPRAQAPAQQRPAAARPVQHEVQPGETLFRISQTYGVTVDDLRRLNNLTGDRIVPGQMLTVRP
jgi:LysM repeat protein